jgi:sporulation protein YlmC with PRC-barrel domain
MKSNIKATNVIRLPSMRAIQTLAWPTMLCGLLMLAAPGPVLSQAVQLVIVDVNVVAQGYRVSKLTGNSVTNDKNEKVGTLDDFVIGHDRSLFAILQVGGFLGIGSRLVAIPYESLVINDETRKIELPGASKEELKKLAEFKYGI